LKIEKLLPEYLLLIGLLDVADCDGRKGDIPDGCGDGVEGHEHGFVVPLLNDFGAQKNCGEECQAQSDHPEKSLGPVASGVPFARIRVTLVNSIVIVI